MEGSDFTFLPSDSSASLHVTSVALQDRGTPLVVNDFSQWSLEGVEVPQAGSVRATQVDEVHTLATSVDVSDEATLYRVYAVLEMPSPASSGHRYVSIRMFSTLTLSPFRVHVDMQDGAVVETNAVCPNCAVSSFVATDDFGTTRLTVVMDAEQRDSGTTAQLEISLLEDGNFASSFMPANPAGTLTISSVQVLPRGAPVVVTDVSEWSAEGVTLSPQTITPLSTYGEHRAFTTFAVGDTPKVYAARVFVQQPADTFAKFFKVQFSSGFFVSETDAVSVDVNLASGDRVVSQAVAYGGATETQHEYSDSTIVEVVLYAKRTDTASTEAELSLYMLSEVDGTVLHQPDPALPLNVLGVEVIEDFDPPVSMCDVNVFTDHVVSCDPTGVSCDVSCHRTPSFTVDSSIVLKTASAVGEDAVFPESFYLHQAGQGAVQFDLSMASSDQIVVPLAPYPRFVHYHTPPATGMPWLWRGLTVHLQANEVAVRSATLNVYSSTNVLAASSVNAPYAFESRAVPVRIELTTNALAVHVDGLEVLSVNHDVSELAYVGLYSPNDPHGVSASGFEFHAMPPADHTVLSSVSRTCDPSNAQWTGTTAKCNAGFPFSPVKSFNFDHSAYVPKPSTAVMSLFGSPQPQLQTGAVLAWHAVVGDDTPTVAVTPVMASGVVSTESLVVDMDTLTFRIPDWEMDFGTTYRLVIGGGAPMASISDALPFEYDAAVVNHEFTSPDMQGCASHMHTRRKFNRWGGAADVLVGTTEPSTVATYCDYSRAGAWTLVSYGSAALPGTLGSPTGAGMSIPMAAQGGFNMQTMPYTALGLGVGAVFDSTRRFLSDFDEAYAMMVHGGGANYATPAVRTTFGDACTSDSFQETEVLCVKGACDLPTSGYTGRGTYEVHSGSALGVFFPGTASAEVDCDWSTADVTNADGNSALYVSLAPGMSSEVATPGSGVVSYDHSAVFAWTNVPRSSCRAVADHALRYDNEGHSELGMVGNPHVRTAQDGTAYMADGPAVLFPRYWDTSMAQYAGVVHTELHMCEHTSDGGGWQRFWWHTSGSASSLSDVLLPDNNCTLADGDDCFGRLPQDVSMESLSLLTRDGAGRTLKWRFVPGNALCEAVFDSLVHGTQYTDGTDFGGATWSPEQILEGDLAAANRGAEADAVPVASRWVYVWHRGVQSFLLDDDSCGNGFSWLFAGYNICDDASSTPGVGQLAPQTGNSMAAGVTLELFWREEVAAVADKPTVSMDNVAGATATYTVSFAMAPSVPYTMQSVVSADDSPLTVSPAEVTVTPEDHSAVQFTVTLPAALALDASAVQIMHQFAPTGTTPTDGDVFASSVATLVVTAAIGNPVTLAHTAEPSLTDDLLLQLVPASETAKAASPRYVGDARVVHAADWEPADVEVGLLSLVGAGALAVRGLDKVMVSTGQHDTLSGSHSVTLTAPVYDSNGAATEYSLHAASVDVSCGPLSTTSGTSSTLSGTVTMASMTEAEFDSARQTMLLEALAGSAGVPQADVQVTSVVPHDSGTNVDVHFSIVHPYDMPTTASDFIMSLRTPRSATPETDLLMFRVAMESVAKTLHRLTGIGCTGNVVTGFPDAAVPAYPGPNAVVPSP